MNSPENTNQDINKKEDEVTAQNGDVNEQSVPADDGFKTGKKSHGLTWETPMEEQAYDDENLSRRPADEEGD